MHFYCLEVFHTYTHVKFLYALDNNRECRSRFLHSYDLIFCIIFLLKILHPLKDLVLLMEKILINALHVAEFFSIETDSMVFFIQI